VVSGYINSGSAVNPFQQGVEAKKGVASALSGSIPMACQNSLGRSSAHATENKGRTQRKAVARNYRGVG